MKKKLLVVALVALVVCLAAVLFFCNKNENNPSAQDGKTPPTAEQWADAGVNGTFNAAVKGELEFSVVEDGEIAMKWTNSDEESLDNTIAWLKEQGFTSYGGENAQKITEEGGKLITYTAEKTVSGIEEASIGRTFTFSLVASAADGEDRTMIAESVYISEDFTVMGQSFKAGELYLDVYESNVQAPASSLVSSWPAAQIRDAMGEDIPAYSGASSGYQLVDVAVSYMKTIQIYVYGAGETDANAYGELLEGNGYAFNADDEVYEKTLASGNVIQIMIFPSVTYHPDTFQMTDVLSVTVMLIKNSGAYSSWDDMDFSDFSGAGLPEYGGGTSFDFDDAMSIVGVDFDRYQQIVDSLGAYESMLDAEQRAELEAARLYLQYASEIKACVVTVYGTDYTDATDYEEALAAAGFIDGMKNTSEHQFQIEITEDEGKALITLTRLPIEIAEEIVDNGSGGSGYEDTPAVDRLEWDDLPKNLKFTIADSYGTEYTVTKIENDYMIEYFSQCIFLKYSDGEWIEYTHSGGSWYETTTYSKITYNTTISTTETMLLGNDVSGFTKEENEDVAGQSCEVYMNYDDSLADYGMVISTVKKLNADGFVMYINEDTLYQGQPYICATREVTLWDTEITGFDIEVPE